MQNFNKIGALVFEKSCPQTSKITVLRKTRLKQEATHRDPNGSGFQRSLSLTLLEFYSGWLEIFGKRSWHVVLLYKKLLKKSIFQSFKTQSPKPSSNPKSRHLPYNEKLYFLADMHLRSDYLNSTRLVWVVWARQINFYVQFIFFHEHCIVYFYFSLTNKHSIQVWCTLIFSCNHTFSYCFFFF